VPDVASLSFNIDSSQARQAIAALEALKATSVQVVQTQQQWTTANTAATAAYGQQRDQIDRLAQSTKAYDGTLTGLISRLNSLRETMNQTQASFNAYQQMITQAQGVAVTLNASVDALDRYVQKSRELRVQQNDLATGLANITAALKNQTDQGHAARLAIEQLGVSLQGIGANRPEEVVQRIADRLRNFAPTQGTLQAAQQVFGQGFGANDLLNLQSQPYIGYRQQETNRLQRDLQAQIDQINTNNLRRDAATQREIDERRDLSSRYSQSNTLAGRLGLDFGRQLRTLFGQSGSEELAELRRISQLPEDQRRGYQGIGSQIGDFFQTGYGGETWRNLFSGQYGANRADIMSRQREEQQTLGYFPALLNRFGRDLQALPGINAYTARTADPRGITPFEDLTQRRAAGTQLADLGDADYQRIVELQERQRRFTAGGDTRQTYLRAFGAQEGERRYANQLARIQQDRLYAQTPEQRLIDDTTSEGLINALPFEQRAQARFRQQATEQLTGTRGGALSLAQQRAVEGRFQSQIGTQLQESSEATQRQIDLQRALSEEVTKGRGAAEDYVRAYTAYIQALQAGAGPERSAQQALESLNLAQQQRVTMGRQVTQQLREENDQRQQQINVAQRNANADPITRRIQELQLGITQNINQQIAAGQLPNPAGGQFRDPTTGQLRTVAGATEAQSVIDERRAELQRQLAGEGVQGAQGIRQGVQDQARDQQAVLDIMRQQGVTLQRASEIYETQKQFNEDIAKAQADRSGKAQEEVANQERLTQEYQRQVDITKNIVENLEKARQASEGATTEQALQGVPAYLRPFIRETAPSIFNAGQVGGGGSGRNNIMGIRNPGQTTGFRDFNSPEESFAAGINQLQYYKTRYGLTTLRQWIMRYAPPKENDTEGYIRRVASKVGIAPDAEIDINDQGLMSRIATEMSRVETGHMPDPGVVQRGTAIAFHATPPPAPATPATPAATTTTAAPAGTPPAGSAGQTPQGVLQSLPDPVTFLRRAYTDIAAGRDPDLSALGMPKDQEDSLKEYLKQRYRQTVEAQKTSIQEAADQQAAEIARLRAQRGLAGRPAEQARVVAPNQNIAPELREQEAAGRRQVIVEQQSLQGANLIAGGRQQLEDQRRLLEAMNGPLQGYATRLREVQAALQAEAEQRQYGLTDMQKEERQRQLLATAIDKQRESLAQQNKTLEDQNELQANLNAAGPFASPGQLRRVQTETQIRQFQRDNPDLAATPQGQQHIDDLRASNAIADQTERMNELRDAAHGAYGALENAFSAIVVHGAKGKDVLKSLGETFQEIFLRTAIYKPAERLMDQLLGSIFGGGDNDNAPSGGRGGRQAANDNSPSIVDRAVGMLGFSGTTSSKSSLPIDNNHNAMRVVVVGGRGTADGGGGGNLLDSLTDAVSGKDSKSGRGSGGSGGDSGGGGLFGSLFSGIGKLFSGSSSNSSDSAVDTAIARSKGEAPPLQGSGGGLFDNFFSSIGKLFGGGGSAGGSGTPNTGAGGSGGGGGLGGILSNYPQGLLDSMFGQGFYQGGGLIGQLFGGGGGDPGGGSGMGIFGSLLGMFGGGGGGADLSGGAMSAGLYAKGGVFPGRVLADYHNQVVDRPTVFAFARGVGMMGEAGPEAIMPLRRGADGRLGVSAPTDGGSTHIHFNISTPDADSFRRAQPQIQTKAVSALNRTALRNSTAS